MWLKRRLLQTLLLDLSSLPVRCHWFHSISPESNKEQKFSDVFREYRKRPVAWNGLLLTLNSTYSIKTYSLQKIDCAMETTTAPNYANFFPRRLRHIFTITNFQNFCWFVNCYSFFFLWNGIVVHLQEFIKKFNDYHITIKFGTKLSKTSIVLIDTTVCKDLPQANNAFCGDIKSW